VRGYAFHSSSWPGINQLVWSAGQRPDLFFHLNAVLQTGCILHSGLVFHPTPLTSQFSVLWDPLMVQAPYVAF
jgi:hypothetical protein